MSSSEPSLPAGPSRRPTTVPADLGAATEPMARSSQPAPASSSPAGAGPATDSSPPPPRSVAEGSDGAAASASPTSTPSGTRRARLVLSRVDPWSVMKVSFVLSVALGIVFVTAVALLWLVLQGLGVFTSLDRTADELTRGERGGGLDLGSALGLGRVLGVTTVLALVNAVLLTALSTLGSFLYNIASSLVGGLQVTLSEDR